MPLPSDILPNGRAYDARAHYERVKTLYMRYPVTDEQACENYAIDMVKRIIRGSGRKPSEEFTFALLSTIEILFEKDRLFWKTPPSEWSLDEQEKALSLDRLRLATDTTVLFFTEVLRRLLPDAVFSPSSGSAVTVPLIQLAPDPKLLIHSLCVDYLNLSAPTDVNDYVFPSLHSQLLSNLLTASGLTSESPTQSASKRLIFPNKSDLDPIASVEAFLHNTPFQFLLTLPVAFDLPAETRYSGHWIIAPPGRGKTTLLHAMLMGDLKKDAAVILMDSKGDLIEPIRELKQLEDRLIIVDPDPEHPIAINPLDIPKADTSLAVSNLEYVFSSLLESKMTPLQTVLFRSVLRALITSFPDPTLETFRDILTNGIDRYKDYIAKLPQDLQEFFYKEFNTKLYEDRRKEIIWRLRLLLENDTMRGMLLALRTRFNIAHAMDAGKVVIINNSKSRLGDQGAEFFGRFFIAQVLAAAQQRAGRRPQDKKPVYFYIDECQNVIARDERIPIILDECRSQKIALIVAHQRVTQITSPNVLDALSNCAIRYTNSDEEARTLAPRFRTTPEFLQSLGRGKFAAFVRDMTPHAIAFEVTKTDFSNIPRLSPGDRAVLTAKMHTDYGVLREPTAAPMPEATPTPAVHPPDPVSAPPPPPPESRSPAASTNTEVPKSRPVPTGSDPHTGDHTEPASTWGDK
jgi:hypothetical protein